jgi:hypothetical protein
VQSADEPNLLPYRRLDSTHSELGSTIGTGGSPRSRGSRARWCCSTCRRVLSLACCTWLWSLGSVSLPASVDWVVQLWAQRFRRRAIRVQRDRVHRLRHAGDRLSTRPMGETIDHSCSGFIVDPSEEAVGWVRYVSSVIYTSDVYDWSRALLRCRVAIPNEGHSVVKPSTTGERADSLGVRPFLVALLSRAVIVPVRFHEWDRLVSGVHLQPQAGHWAGSSRGTWLIMAQIWDPMANHFRGECPRAQLRRPSQPSRTRAFV